MKPSTNGVDTGMHLLRVACVTALSTTACATPQAPIDLVTHGYGALGPRVLHPEIAGSIEWSVIAGDGDSKAAEAAKEALAERLERDLMPARPALGPRLERVAVYFGERGGEPFHVTRLEVFALRGPWTHDVVVAGEGNFDPSMLEAVRRARPSVFPPGAVIISRMDYSRVSPEKVRAGSTPVLDKSELNVLRRMPMLNQDLFRELLEEEVARSIRSSETTLYLSDSQVTVVERHDPSPDTIAAVMHQAQRLRRPVSLPALGDAWVLSVRGGVPSLPTSRHFIPWSNQVNRRRSDLGRATFPARASPYAFDVGKDEAGAPTFRLFAATSSAGQAYSAWKSCLRMELARHQQLLSTSAAEKVDLASADVEGLLARSHLKGDARVDCRDAPSGESCWIADEDRTPEYRVVSTVANEGMWFQLSSTSCPTDASCSHGRTETVRHRPILSLRIRPKDLRTLTGSLAPRLQIFSDIALRHPGIGNAMRVGKALVESLPDEEEVFFEFSATDQTWRVRVSTPLDIDALISKFELGGLPREEER